MGLYVWGCGARPMGLHGVVVAAVSRLWSGPMGFMSLWGLSMIYCMYRAAVPDLFGFMGLLWLQSLAYGLGLWGYRCLWGFPIFMYGAAVFDLWGSMGNADFHFGCGLGPMGCTGLRCQTYGDLHCCCGCVL